jgi:FemAB-related protein (PEP-CTERM system-associated)
VDHFYDVFARNMHDLGTPVYPRQLFSETLRLFPEAAQVFLVHSGQAVAAAGICLRFRDIVLVPWASSLREFRHQCPNTLLYWTMVEHAIQTGARVFDFGRSSPGSGPHQFKRQWGAVETPLNWEYVLLGNHEVPTDGAQSPKFAAAVATWKRLPLWLTNQLGPAVVRHLP